MADHRERDSYYSQTDLRSKNDDPPNSRLFVICHKSLEEDDLRKAFEKFGKIEDIWVVKDRNTGENKGESRADKSKVDYAPFHLVTLHSPLSTRGTLLFLRKPFPSSRLLFVTSHTGMSLSNAICPAGVTYIKFSKTSEAAFALEEMNGKMLGSVGRPIKVMIASKWVFHSVWYTEWLITVVPNINSIWYLGEQFLLPSCMYKHGSRNV